VFLNEFLGRLDHLLGASDCLLRYFGCDTRHSFGNGLRAFGHA
jgi:hypothetical protein